MIKKQSWKLLTAAFLAGATILAAGPAFTGQAWAGPFSRDGGGFEGLGRLEGSGFGMMHFGPLVEQLLFPCRNDCVQAEDGCQNTAESAALTCASNACGTDISNAQTDCAAGRTSQACLTDVSALITCVRTSTCVTTESSALSTCANNYKLCVAACNPTPTPTPTP